MPVQVRASLWFLISTFLQKAISVISTPIFTRLLTTGQYGEYNVFQSWMGIISVIVTGSVLITTFNNSGMYFENTAVQSLSSVIKLMAVFSAAFLPFFMKIGGLLF